MIKILLWIIIVPLVIMPSALGWWYIDNFATSFSIPTQHWVIPTILILAIFIFNEP